jgi:hypothetical protein
MTAESSLRKRVLNRIATLVHHHIIHGTLLEFARLCLESWKAGNNAYRLHRPKLQVRDFASLGGRSGMNRTIPVGMMVTVY